MPTPTIPGVLKLDADDLAGNMLIPVQPGGPRPGVTTLSDLGQFLSDDASVLNTAITTVGAGTLTAAALLGGLITRSGPTAAYTDTTATAAQLNTAQGTDTPAGSSRLIEIKNTVPFPATLAAGSGVTLSPSTQIIPPNSVGFFLLTRTSATAYVLLNIAMVPLTTGPLAVATALTTVGAGTITAAGIVGGLTTRGGTQSAAAFVDTTDTAANIIAALPNANIGQSFFWTYRNNTDGTPTITAAAGVTVTGGIVPKNSWATFLVSYTAAATITMVRVAEGQTVVLPPSKFVTGAAATFAAGDITGASVVNYENTGDNATLTTRTGTQMFGDIPNCQIGHCYQLNIRNTHATSATLTAADASVTLTGTMTIAQNVTRQFNVVFTSATQCTITSMGISAAAA